MSEIYRWLSTIFVGFILVACTPVNNEPLSKNSSNEHFIVKPVSIEGNNKSPVVFFLQSSAGSNINSQKWARWFANHGIASVFIDSAKIRNRQNLFGVNYGRDLSLALDAVKGNPHIDLTRYAVMGFSRGGTGALQSRKFLKPDHNKPDFIFSLYPGDQGKCPNSYIENTRVFVFYGALDNWGTYQNTREACNRMANRFENTSFVSLANAHHGYDADWTGTWKCCGGNTFSNRPNTAALEETRSIILKAIEKKW